MTDLPLEGWERTPGHFLGLAEAVERATSSRIFLVRLVARALLAIDAGLLPTRRGVRALVRGLSMLAGLIALPLTLPLRELIRLCFRSPATTTPDPIDIPDQPVEPIHLDVQREADPPISLPGSVASTPAAPSVLARVGQRWRAGQRSRLLGEPSLLSLVLADLTLPARILVPRQPVSGALSVLERLPALLADARTAPATLAKLALASSMTLAILGGSAAAAVHSGGGPAGITGQMRSALPGFPTAPGARAALGNGKRAIASGDTGSSPTPAALPPVAAPAPTGPPVVPAVRGALPPGKGMWIYVPSEVEGGNVVNIVRKATASGLNYLYVHLGSSNGGFNAQPFLDQLLPVAHAAHIRIYGWDFPYFTPPQGDVDRAVAEINYRTPSGDRIDGFAADIEPEPGVNLSAATADAYTSGLRTAVGPKYPLIAVVPRPNGSDYPMNEVVSRFDAVAVMDYWLNRNPGSDIAGADANLAGQGVAMIPIGQAYDGAEEGVPGTPSGPAILQFMQVAEQTGAVGVSFWSWQDTTAEIWDAVRTAPEFSLPVAPAVMNPGQIKAWQELLTSLGFPAWPTGVWDQSSVTAVSNYQRAANLPVTGVVDGATKAIILTPFPPPVQPPAAPAPPPAPAPAPAPAPTVPASPLPLVPTAPSSTTTTSAPPPPSH